jgi:tRNA G18 (ribose-2'-O)-methylase SpoU
LETEADPDNEPVATLVRIDDATDVRLADYVRLRDVQLRRSLESERGLFIAEGEKVVRRAAEAGCEPRSFLMAQRWLPGLDDVLARRADVPCYVVSEALAEQITGFHVHRGALASFHRPKLPSVDAVVAGARRLVVLEDIVDHTNVGAVTRAAAALGVDAVLVSPRCADPLYRRAIKVSMGAVFSVPWTRIDPWPASIAYLRELGFAVFALSPNPDGMPIDELAGRRHERLALILGAEGAGISPQTAGLADGCVRIPMSAGIDSLNVASAAAIACYATRCTP